jgi:GNAT superfamily N-acetyltransferase
MADEEAVQQLAAELFRSFSDPPIFLPSLQETMPNLRQLVHELLADPASPVWIAIRHDRVEAMQLFITPDSPSWHLSPLSTPEQSLYLSFACTDANARSTGINTALLARTMEWAAGAGYAYYTLHYLTASRAAKYWTSQGFRQLTVSLRRHLDPRLERMDRDC